MRTRAWQQLAQLTGLESINLRHTDITDAGMVHFAALKNLKRLDITSVDITEKGLEGLAPLTQLEDLDLSFTRFAEPGLEMITKLTALKRLGLEQTSITDTGMAWVAQLPKLEALNLNYTPVSDAGLALLSKNTAFIGAQARSHRPDRQVALVADGAEESEISRPVPHAALRAGIQQREEGAAEGRRSTGASTPPVRGGGHSHRSIEDEKRKANARLVACSCLRLVAGSQRTPRRSRGATADSPAVAYAIERIEQRGGWVARDKDGTDRRGVARAHVGDRQRHRLHRRAEDAEEARPVVHLRDRSSGIKKLQALQQLEDLTLDTTEFLTDASMAHLRANRALRRLVVRGVDITDAGMPYIGEMTGLRSLDISYTMLGDVGLEQSAESGRARAP